MTRSSRSSFSFNATVSVILRVGARPVFVDVREDDFCMDPALVEAAITPRTRAIMPVHLYGLMADMDPLVEIARRHGLAIIEDAAQAHGATYGGRRAGQFGPAMFSLYATKNLMTGEGGFATTDDEELADRHPPVPQPRHAGPLPPRGAGDELQAHGPRGGDRPRAARSASTSGPSSGGRNAAALSAGLADDYLVPTVPDGREHVWHQFVDALSRASARRCIDGLAARGMGSLIYYPIPIHRQAYLQAYLPGAADLRLPVTDRLADEVLAIPVHPLLTEDELATIVGAVRDTATPVRR